MIKHFNIAKDNPFSVFSGVKAIMMQALSFDDAKETLHCARFAFHANACEKLSPNYYLCDSLKFVYHHWLVMLGKQHHNADYHDQSDALNLAQESM